MARSDPRRIALLVVMIGAAVGFAWASAANAVVIGLSVLVRSFC